MEDIINSDLHISVLLNELVSSINIFDDKQNIIVDCTLGLAGHSKKIIEKMNPGDILVGFDADIRNLELANAELENVRKDIKIITIHSNFVNLKFELEKRGITKITGIFYDLGISSLHIDNGDRGFSFKLDGPLDMRFDTSSPQKASIIINRYNKEDLYKIFREYGEEPQSRKLADYIVEHRKENKFETTQDLSEAIEAVSKDPKSKNRIFQAIRIETNNELENMKDSIEDAISILEKDGTIFVISFHSLEDRIVKQIFKRETRDCICRDIICSCHHTKSLNIITKKPILPTENEIKINPRSRSAKARAARKIV